MADRWVHSDEPGGGSAVPKAQHSIMLKNLSSRVLVGALALLVVSLSARAASPQLTRILPRGGQRGTEVVLTFEGLRLADAQEVFVYEPGVTVTKVEQPTD